MKKQTITIVAMFLFCLGCTIGTAKELIRNGEFKQLKQKTAKQTNVVGNSVPVGWGVAGGTAEVSNSTDNKNNLVLTKAVAYSWLMKKWNTKAYDVKGEITASGTGQLKVQFSTCVKKKANQPFSHSKKTVVTTFKLEPTEKTFTFNYKMTDNEVGYIYLYVKGGPVTISKVSIVSPEESKPAK